MTFKELIAIVGGALAVIGSVIGGFLFIDNRYISQDEIKALRKEIKDRSFNKLDDSTIRYGTFQIFHEARNVSWAESLPEDTVRRQAPLVRFIEGTFPHHFKKPPTILVDFHPDNPQHGETFGIYFSQVNTTGYKLRIVQNYIGDLKDKDTLRLNIVAMGEAIASKP